MHSAPVMCQALEDTRRLWPSQAREAGTAPTLPTARMKAPRPRGCSTVTPVGSDLKRQERVGLHRVRLLPVAFVQIVTAAFCRRHPHAGGRGGAELEPRGGHPREVGAPQPLFAGIPPPSSMAVAASGPFHAQLTVTEEGPLRLEAPPTTKPASRCRRDAWISWHQLPPSTRFGGVFHIVDFFLGSCS